MLEKSRKAIFSLLGPAYVYKCLVSPAVKLYLYKTFINPIMKSGLSSFALRTTQIEPLAIMQRKILKSCLQLNKYAATSAIYFISSELPIEGQLHQDAFSLFYSLWTNPNTKVHDLVKYLL